MKHSLLKSWLRACLLMIAMLSAGVADAQTFTFGNMTYQIIGTNEVKLTKSGLWSGDVILPENVEYKGVTYKVVEIGESAFSDVTKVTQLRERNGFRITSIEIPESIKKIGDFAFASCKKLTTVEFPSHLVSIGEYAFGYCALKRFKIESVDTIKNYAFYMSEVEEVDINECKIIGMSAFDGALAPNINMQKLKTLHIGSGIISEMAFEDQANLESVVLGDGVSEIRSGAFRNDVRLKDVKLGKTLTHIYPSAFSNCRSLSLLTIPASVKTIDSNAFEGCNNLRELRFEDSSEEIKLSNENKSSSSYGLFENNPIETLYLGRNINYNLYPSFWKIKTLKNVEFGSYVTSIPKKLFADDDNIVSIKVPWINPFAINDNVFSDSAYKKANLVIPGGTLKNYQATDGWKNFINVDDGRQIQTITWDQENTQVRIGDTLELSATASSGDAVAYSIVNGAEYAELVNTANGFGLKALKVGTVTVEADQTGNDNYKAAKPVQKTFSIIKAKQSISWDFDEQQYNVGDTIPLTATASSGLTVQYSFSNGGDLVNVFEENGVYKMKGKRQGNVTIVATQPGNGTYDAAESVSKSFKLVVKYQELKWDLEFIDKKYYVNDSIRLEATASSGEPVTFYIYSGDEYGFVEKDDRGYYLKFTHAGTLNIAAHADRNDEYLEITNFRPLTIVDPDEQTISWDDQKSTNVKVGRSLMLNAKSSADSKIIYSITAGSDHASLKEQDGNYYLVGSSVGSVTVKAKTERRTEYVTAESEKTFDVVDYLDAPLISIDGDVLNITSADEGTTIYYTLDGSDPTTSSKQFTEDVQLSASCVVKAIATKAGRNNSDITTVEFHNAQYPNITNVGDVFTAKIINNGEQDFLQYFKVTSVYPFEVMLLRRQKMEPNWDKSTVKGSVEVPAQIEHNGITFNITTLDGESLKEIPNITEVKFNEGLKEVHNGVLTGTASYLEPMVFPNSVEYIGDGNFGYKTVVLGSGLKRIGYMAFRGSNCLTLYSLNPVPPTLDRPEEIIYSDGNVPDDFVLYVPVGAKSAYESAPGWEKLFGHIREFDPTSIEKLKADVTVSDGYWYTLSGQRLAKKPVATGVYIHNGKKVVIK